MNAQDLYRALTTLSKIPCGSKEQRMLALLNLKTEAVSIDELLEDFGGNSPSIRSVLSSLRDKKMISVIKGGAKMSYVVSPKGKKILNQALNP